jgi:hypothetical protein
VSTVFTVFSQFLKGRDIHRSDWSKIYIDSLIYSGVYLGPGWGLSRPFGSSVDGGRRSDLSNLLRTYSATLWSLAASRALSIAPRSTAVHTEQPAGAPSVITHIGQMTGFRRQGGSIVQKLLANNRSLQAFLARRHHLLPSASPDRPIDRPTE